MDNLYKIIEDLCQKRDIRPGRLCDDLGLSRGLLTDLKMGRKKGLSAKTIQKIADYFGVSVEYLLSQDAAHPSPDVLDEIDIGFYGDFKSLTEEQKATVRDMVRVMRQRQEAKRKKSV